MAKGTMNEGVSPRKAMAMGGGGNFGVESVEKVQGHMGMHPDATAKTGRKGPMADHERGIGMPVHHDKNHHPAQAAPNHGPGHVGGYGKRG